MAYSAKAWPRDEHDSVNPAFFSQLRSTDSHDFNHPHHESSPTSVGWHCVTGARALIVSFLGRFRWARAFHVALWENAWLRRLGAMHNVLFDVLGRIHWADQNHIDPPLFDGLGEVLTQCAMLRAGRCAGKLRCRRGGPWDKQECSISGWCTAVLGVSDWFTRHRGDLFHFHSV